MDVALSEAKLSAELFLRTALASQLIFWLALIVRSKQISEFEPPILLERVARGGTQQGRRSRVAPERLSEESSPTFDRRHDDLRPEIEELLSRHLFWEASAFATDDFGMDTSSRESCFIEHSASAHVASSF